MLYLFVFAADYVILLVICVVICVAIGVEIVDYFARILVFEIIPYEIFIQYILLTFSNDFCVCIALHCML